MVFGRSHEGACKHFISLYQSLLLFFHSWLSLSWGKCITPTMLRVFVTQIPEWLYLERYYNMSPYAYVNLAILLHAMQTFLTVHPLKFRLRTPPQCADQKTRRRPEFSPFYLRPLQRQLFKARENTMTMTQDLAKYVCSMVFIE